MTNNTLEQKRTEKPVGKGCMGSIKDRFDTLLLAKGLRQRDLVNLTGFDKADICRIVNGKIIPPLIWKLKIAKILDVDTSVIWGDSNE